MNYFFRYAFKQNQTKIIGIWIAGAQGTLGVLNDNVIQQVKYAMNAGY